MCIRDSFWGLWKGNLKDNNKGIVIPVHITYQFYKGKIVEEYGYWNTAELMNEIQAIENKKIELEDIETDEVQPEIKSEDFMDFVNGEYDIETLELMQSVISGRVRKLKSLIDIANRKEIKGYRK